MELKFFQHIKKKINKIKFQNFITVIPVGADWFMRTARQTDRQTDMKKLTVDFRKFVKAPKNTQQQTLAFYVE